MALKLVFLGDGPQAFVMGDAYARWLMAEPVHGVTRPGTVTTGERPSRVRRLGVLEQLAEDGRLRKIQMDAGREIRAYWRAWTVAFSAGVSNLTGERGGGVAEPLVLRSMAERYRAWAGWAEARRVRGELSALQVTLDLVLSDRTPWELRREYRIGDVRALRIVQEALLEYGRLAGWVEPEREAA